MDCKGQAREIQNPRFFLGQNFGKLSFLFAFFSFSPKHFSVRGLLNCEHEPRGGTYWKSADFRAERPDTALVISPGAPRNFRGGPQNLPKNASGRLGAHVAASGFALLICSSLSLRRALVFFDACGGLLFFF